jgi:hypothetical protein
VSDRLKDMLGPPVDDDGHIETIARAADELKARIDKAEEAQARGSFAEHQAKRAERRRLEKLTSPGP